MLSTLCTICWALTLKRFILASVAWTRGWQTFSVTYQIVNIFGFVSHTVSVATVQLCRCYMKATGDNIRTQTGFAGFRYNFV